MRGISRAGLCALALTALVLAGCGSADGDNKADAGGKTSTDKPRRGYEASAGDYARNVTVGYSDLPKGEHIKLTFDDSVVLGEADLDSGGHISQDSLEVRGNGSGGAASVNIAKEHGPITGTAEIPSGAQVDGRVSDTYAGPIKNGQFSLDVGQ